ncbi:MAG: ABC transporter permease, partial [Fastidiosipila sp.]|nr:ABC transporter permease [Fastidiosipila sp.]
MQIIRGMCMLLNSGKPVSGFPESLSQIMGAEILGISISIIYVFIAYFVMIVVMSKTRYGRYVYAIGGNRDAAKLSGVKVQRIELFTYAIAGLFAAIGGIMLLSRLTYADPNAGNGYEMNAIAATVIGGTAMSGGKGKLVNTFVGAIILGMLTTGLQILNVAVHYQSIITGIAIAGAVYLDKIKERQK